MILILTFSLIHLFGFISFDEGNYYLQSVEWNEKYPAIKGLASFEERLGFNSSFFLLLAPFTFSFILGSPQYIIHILFTILVLAWFFKEMIISKFEVKRVTLFVVYIIFIWLFVNYYWSISNDSIIHVIIFYLIAKLFLYPEKQKTKYLLYILSFVYLVTIKTFVIPFSFVFIIYFVSISLRNKEMKPLFFITIVSFILISLWCIRSVVLSGYLVYPFHELDLFDVDWKLPQEIAEKERYHITHAYGGFRRLLEPFSEFLRLIKRFPHTFPIKPLAMISLYLGTVISVIFISIVLIKKRKSLPAIFYWIFAAIIFQIIFFLLTSCNERFISSTIFLSIFLSVSLLATKKKVVSQKLGILFLLMSIMVIGLQVPRLIYIENTKLRYDLVVIPYTVDEKTRYTKTQIGYELYELNNRVEIYLAKGKFVYDVVPAVTKLKEGQYSGRFQDYDKIEARGSRVEDGFRYKEDK